MVLSQLLVAGLASVVCIAIHAAVMTIVVRVARRVSARAAAQWPDALLIVTMIATVSVLMVAHVFEVAVWAETYALTGAVPAGADVLYFAFVNYTTLGYGDVVPVARWRLLGPATAMCGVLLIGWSTAVIFEVLRRSLAQWPAA
jgi:hypothetical protein